MEFLMLGLVCFYCVGIIIVAGVIAIAVKLIRDKKTNEQKSNTLIWGSNEKALEFIQNSPVEMQADHILERYLIRREIPEELYPALTEAVIQAISTKTKKTGNVLMDLPRDLFPGSPIKELGGERLLLALLNLASKYDDIICTYAAWSLRYYDDPRAINAMISSYELATKEHIKSSIAASLAPMHEEKALHVLIDNFKSHYRTFYAELHKRQVNLQSEKFNRLPSLQKVEAIPKFDGNIGEDDWNTTLQVLIDVLTTNKPFYGTEYDVKTAHMLAIFYASERTSDAYKNKIREIADVFVTEDQDGDGSVIRTYRLRDFVKF